MLPDLILASVLYSNYVPANLVTNKAEKSHYIAAQSSPTPNSDSTAGKMIAHSVYNLTLEARVGNINVPMGFYIQVYSSKPKNNGVVILHTAPDLYQFLRNNEYDQILFFKMLASQIHHEKPSVVIDNNKKTMFYDLEGRNDLADGIFEFEQSFDMVQPKLIEYIIRNIIIGRGIIELRRRGIIILPIPKIPDVEI